MKEIYKLDEQIREEFFTFDLFESIKLFNNQFKEYKKQIINSEDQITVKKENVPIGFSSIGGTYSGNGLVMYFQSKEFKEPIPISVLKCTGEIINYLNWDIFYKQQKNKKQIKH